MTDERTLVHLLRHGEVFNPEKILYGRLPGYKLSDLGEQMANRIGEALGDNDITHVIASPLERAQQTAAPLAQALKLKVETDPRLIEADNVFEGQRVSVGDGALKDPKSWKYLWDPFTPSWGEPYVQISRRMRAAVASAVKSAAGHEAVLVSHQLPIWVARLAAEGRPFIHDPRKRQCSLASLTTLEYHGTKLVSITYTEPCADLLVDASPVVGA